MSIIFLFICTGITPSVAVDTVEPSCIPISNGKTLYVGGTGENNYTSIQDAIDNASDGDTVFVYNGTYKRVEIEKSINLTGEDKYTTIIEGPLGSRSVIHIDANSVIVKGFTIKNGMFGVYIRSDYNIIFDNIIINNCESGIDLYGSHENKIIGNDIYSHGIILEHSNSNNISNNRIYSIYLGGIDLRTSKSNIIRNNTISNSDYGIDIRFKSEKNILDNNKLFHNFDGIHLTTGKLNTITNNKISNNFCGIYSSNSRGNKIINNNISNNVEGVFLRTSCFNSFLRNNFLNNDIDADFFNSFLNKWNQNFWNKSRILPKLIIGSTNFGLILLGHILFGGDILDIPWINIDWFPAKEPYDIEVVI